MANQTLKKLFQDVHLKMVSGITPDLVMDALLEKKVISFDDYSRLRQTPVIQDRCRDLMSKLYSSSHPQTFIHLRLALLDEYWWLVNEIDKQLPSQLHLGNSTDREYYILPRSEKRNQLHEALKSEHFEDASKLLGSLREADLVECFQSSERCCESCLHLIAALSDRQQAAKLCRELLKRTTNAKNRECLLNMRTVHEFNMGGRKVRVRVAAIHIAAYNGNSGVVRLLCQEYGVDANCSTSETIEEEPKKGISALEWATREGHTEVVKALLDNKADVNASRADGVTPLYIAAQQGHAEVVKLLLHSKANVNARRHTDSVTPLNVAAQNGHTEVVKQLLDNGADVNASKRNGVSPMFIASQNGHIEVVKLLLENKADVNASRRTDDVTPLYAAAQYGHKEIVKLLLANRAVINARSKTGDKPIDAARRNQHLDIVKLLQ